MISQEDNSPLTLYSIAFSQFSYFSWISIVSFDQVSFNKCMHIHLSPKHYPSIKEEGRYIFHEKVNFCKMLCTVSIRTSLLPYGCDITDTCIRRVLPERGDHNTKINENL